VADIPGVVAGLSARGDDRSAAAVAHANEGRADERRAGNGQAGNRAPA
jgi:hypothetical protein